MSLVVLLSIGVGVVLTLPIAWRVRAGRFDPFEPILVFVLFWGVVFVVRPIAIVVRDDTNFYGVDIGPTLDESVLLGLVGAVAFVAGYELRLGRRIAARTPDPANEVRSDIALLGAVLTSAAGVVAFGLVLLPGGGLDAIATFFDGRSPELTALIDGSSIYLWYGSLVVVPAALIAVAIALSDRTASTIAVAGALLVVALLRTVPTGNRAFLVVLVGGIVVFAFLRLQRRPRVVALVVGLCLALLVSHATSTFRYPETRDSVASVLRGLASTPTDALRPLYEGPDAEMAPALAGALTAVPDRLPHRYGGATVGDLLVRPIPRQLWSNKPEPPGQQVTAEVWPVAVETGAFDPAFTPMLSFYWDFAAFGVLVGMAALGVLVRSLWEYFSAYAASLAAQLLFAAGLWFLVAVLRHDTTLVVVWGLLVFGPLLAILRLAGVAGRREPTMAPFESGSQPS